MAEPMTQKIENVFYPIIDGIKLKCVDIRFKGNNAVCNLDTYRYYWDCTFIILPEQKRYLLKEFAEKCPSSFDAIVDYMDEHNLEFKVLSHTRILYNSEWLKRES